MGFDMSCHARNFSAVDIFMAGLAQGKAVANGIAQCRRCVPRLQMMGLDGTSSATILTVILIADKDSCAPGTIGI
jgi:hypothetical protein